MFSILGRFIFIYWRILNFYILGGFIVSPKLTFSGIDISYLYPDCRTALVGDFSNNGKMVEARLGEVIGTKNSSFSGECLCCKELSVIDPRYHILSDQQVITEILSKR